MSKNEVTRRGLVGPKRWGHNRGIEKYIMRSLYSTPRVFRMINSKTMRCARNVAGVGIRKLLSECILNLEGSRHLGDLLYMMRRE
jgi:hypothetical protein